MLKVWINDTSTVDTLNRISRASETIVQFKHLNYSSVWIWYFVSVFGFTPSSARITRKSLDLNCGPLSVQILDSIPKYNSLLTKLVATMSPGVSAVGVFFIMFKNLFVITAISLLLDFVFGRIPKMSAATDNCGLVGGNNRSLCCLLLVRRVLLHRWQSYTVDFKSLAMSC